MQFTIILKLLMATIRWVLDSKAVPNLIRSHGSDKLSLSGSTEGLVKFPHMVKNTAHSGEEAAQGNRVHDMSKWSQVDSELFSCQPRGWIIISRLCL